MNPRPDQAVRIQLSGATMSGEVFHRPELLYHTRVPDVVEADMNYVFRKDLQYSASWKKRDGQGAWFTMVRPWDRLESILKGKYGNDVFQAISQEGLEGPDGSVIACIRDVRRYLMLLEAHMMHELEPKAVEVQDGKPEETKPLAITQIEEITKPGTPEDGGHHSKMQVTEEEEGEAAGEGLPFRRGWGTMNDLSMEARDAFTRLAQGIFQLDDVLTPAEYEALIKSDESYAGLFRPVWKVRNPNRSQEVDVVYTDIYQQEGELFRFYLDIDQVPADQRDCYRTLYEEQNLSEAQSLGEHIGLYDWHQSPLRYIIRATRRHWIAA